MKTEVKVPSVGESITSGVIVGWLKSNGETVSEGENLFELETDKAVLEIPSPGDGVLEILVQEDEEVTIGQTVATLDSAGGQDQPAAEPQPGESAAAPEKAEPEADEPESTAPAAEAEKAEPAQSEQKPESKAPAEPAQGEKEPEPEAPAEKEPEPEAPAEKKQEPEAPSGLQPEAEAVAQPQAGTFKQPQGQPDPERAVAAPQKSEAQPEPAPVKPEAVSGRRTERVRMTAIRRNTARRLVQAKQTAAYLTTFNEVDMQKVIDIRSHHKDEFEKEHGIRIGFMSFFVKACCQSLKEFPDVNAQVDGEDIIYNHFYDIGVAISIDRGLLVPVIRDADKLHFAEIEAAIADLASRAVDKKLQPDELTGGTFTITNGGVFGSLMSTPIPAYPQSAILGMHGIKKRPVVIDDQMVIRPMMYVALSYDHRLIDGRQAIGFLARIKEFIENPDKLLLEL